MKLMRGDMGGAATVMASMLAIAKLKLPYVPLSHLSDPYLTMNYYRVNVIAVTPLTENMPGVRVTALSMNTFESELLFHFLIAKRYETRRYVRQSPPLFSYSFCLSLVFSIYAMNGKSIEVDNTDAEGRLVLADAMYYASKTFTPHTLIDVATLTGYASRYTPPILSLTLRSYFRAMDVALGEIYTGVFTNSDELWNGLNQAGEKEYDRFWRMPIDEDYGPQIYSSNADLCNVSPLREYSNMLLMFVIDWRQVGG